MDDSYDDYSQNRYGEYARDGANKTKQEDADDLLNGKYGDYQEKLNDFPEFAKKFMKKLDLMYKMVSDWRNGEYKEIPWQTIGLIVFAIIYFLNPMDLIPDIIPLVGLVDDAAILGFVWSSVQEDLKRYADWKGLPKNDYF